VSTACYDRSRCGFHDGDGDPSGAAARLARLPRLSLHNDTDADVVVQLVVMNAWSWALVGAGEIAVFDIGNVWLTVKVNDSSSGALLVRRITVLTAVVVSAAVCNGAAV
jgi:hypothetical protein